jgi:hypothetical protein
MPREVTSRDLQDLGDERFEQLVASLVFAEEPCAERPANPDGGADVLVPASGAQRARVWQAKHYTSHISWSKCESSLDDGVASYDPGEVTFVFARDLTKPQRDKFTERLVDRHPSVKVKHWGLHRIQELLARYPDIACRYFGEDRIDALPSLIRAFQQGGKELENTRDLADRAFDLDTYADVSDPSYEYDVSFGRADLPKPLWSEPPFMVVEQIRGDRRVTTEARLRPEAQADVLCGFSADEAGERAKDRVREAFAAGQSIDLTEGLWLRVENAPVVAKEALDAARDQTWDQATSTLSPGPPQELEVRLGARDDALRRIFGTRPLPPAEGSQFSFGSIDSGLALFADFALSKPSTVSLNLRLSFRRSEDSAVDAQAAKFMLEFLRAERVTCIAPGLLPDAGLVLEGANKPHADEADLAHLEFCVALLDAVATIEANFGSLAVPDTITRGDFEQAVAAASILRRDGGSVSFEELSIELPYDQVDEFIRLAQAGHPGRHPVRFKVFGRVLDLGLAEFNTPPVRLVATERGDAPDEARIRLRTENTNIPFRLVQRGQPEESPATSSKLWTPAQGPSGLVVAPKG